MRIYYILAFRVTLLSVLFFVASEALGQSMPAFQPYDETKLYSWSDPYESYQYKRDPTGLLLRFRLLKPNGFDESGEDDKFPLIVFLHGSGESGDSDPTLQDNEKQLVHGGQIHMNAVQNGTFPGFLLYPQMRKGPFLEGVRCEEPGGEICQNNWNPDWLESVRYVIEKLIADYKVDPSRIYIHGLSGGGGGAFRFLTMYPEYFAAANPMSAAHDEFRTNDIELRYIHIPIRLSQGGRDGAPDPTTGNNLVDEIRNEGGSIRYDYYPNNGHDTWNAEYNQPDFFSWFLSHKKNQIHVFYEQSAFCPGQSFSIKLGLSKTLNLLPPHNQFTNNNEIVDYQWAKDDTSTIIQQGVSVNEITVTESGTYYARFQRSNGIWSDWSDGVTIDNSRGPSAPPVITSNGQSTTLPALDGSGAVLLSGTANKEEYQWQLNGSAISGETDFNFTASMGGAYTLTSKDPAQSPYEADAVTPTMYRALNQGCTSLPSNEIVVTTESGFGSPAPPDNFFVASNSLTSIIVNWDDRSDNETGFELYRSNSPSGGYELVGILPAIAAPNPQQYTDTGLEPNTIYYYRMRAVNNSGGSAYTNVASAASLVDTQAPSAPVLTTGGTARTVINLFWSGSTDNVAIVEYDVYQNGVQIASTTGTTYSATNVIALQSYYFTVRARDFAGNVSTPSNQVTAAAVNNGVFYKYYHHSGLSSTTQIETSGTLIKTGTLAQFNLDPASQSPGNRTNNFAFVYEGYITIPTSGNYTFYTSSDDGSQLFLNDALLVDNDGTHGTRERNGSVSLSSGTYPMKITFFENGGGASLTVLWRGPNISKQIIPASALSDTYPPPAALINPSALAATSESYQQIDITWQDNSDNETAFEVQRSTSSNGTYQVVHVAPAQTGTGSQESWSDIGLSPSTTYYYKVRAINNASASALVGPASATTAAAPTTPTAPTSLVATPLINRIDLAWTNVSGESGYEIQKSANPSSGFSTIETKVANITTFSDTQVSGHATYYYRVRSVGNGGTASGWSPVASATTPNSAPVLVDVPDQTILENSDNPQTIHVSATDADLDPITFNVTGLPATSNVTDNGYGQGVISLTNVAPGNYNINIEASDGTTMSSDSFVLAVGNNHTPVVTALTVNGVSAPTPITIVPNQSAEAGRKITMVFTVTDAPNDDNNLIAPVVSNLPTFATATWNGSENSGSYTLSFNTTPATVGIYENIKIIFRDAEGGINVKSFAFIVVPFDPNYTISLNFVGDPTITSPAYNEGAYFESAPWNNIAYTGGSNTPILAKNLKDESGNTVKYVKFSAVRWSEIPNNSDWSAGQYPADPGAVFTEKVRKSFWKNNTGGAGGATQIVKFTNLNPYIKYKCTLYGGVPGSGSLNTIYEVSSTYFGNGNVNAWEPLPALDVINNTQNIRISTNHTPSPTGELQIRVKGDGTPGVFFYLNALILEATYIATTPPNSPSNLAATAPLNNRVDLTWVDNSLNETGFNIYRATDSNVPFTTPIDSVGPNIKAYSDNTAVGRTTYYYSVTGTNTHGNSAPSNTVIITTPNGTPALEAIPLTTVATGGDVHVNLSATDPENDPITLSGLNLPAFATMDDNGDGTGSIHFEPGATDAGIYNIIVKATDNFLASGEREFTLIVTDSEYEQAVYVNLVADHSSDENLPWNNVIPTSLPSSVLLHSGGGSSGITIDRSGGWIASSNSVGVNTGDNSGKFPDRVLQSGWTTSTTSSIGATITLGGLNDDKRYNITIIGSRNEFWFANTIYRASDVDKALNTSKNKSKFVKFSGLEPSSGTISFTVRKDNTSWSDGGDPIGHRDAVISGILIEVYTPALEPISPKNLTAKGTSKTSITLTWEDNSSNETGFQVERAETPTGPFSLRTTVITPATGGLFTWTDTGLPQNKAYAYRVRAVSDGGISDFTNVATASTWDQVILLNITPNAGPDGLAPSPWNNGDAGDPQAGTIYGNLNSDAGPTDVDVEILSSGNEGVLGVLDGGYVPNSAPFGLYPSALQVYKNYIYFLPFLPPTELRVRQLDPKMAYDLEFFSNEWNFTQTGAPLITDFGYNGTFKSLFNGRNITETVSFDQILPEKADSSIYFQIISNPEALAAVWSAMEIHSYTPIAVAFDSQAPTIPQNLQASNVTGGSLDLTWTASTDNVGVWEYNIFQDAGLVATVGSNTATITGLTPSTNYIFKVRAVDAKGNMSVLSNALEVTTGTGVFYYWTRVSPVTDPANWNTAEDGTGTAASSFTTVDQYFVLTGNATIDEEFIISGTNTKLIINSGVESTITTQSDLRLYQLEIASGSSLSVVANGTEPAVLTLGSDNGGGLLIETGCTLSLGGNALVLQGDGAINPGGETGRISINGGDLTFETPVGTHNSNLYFDPTNNVGGDLRINTSQTSQINLKSRVAVRGVVSISGGKLNSDGNLVLLSDASATARVAPIQNLGSIEGNVEFQRYLNPKGRVYRYLGTPVSGTTVQEWQQYIPITGNFEGSSPQSSAPSMFYYDEDAAPTPGWQPYPTTDNLATLQVGRGYSVFDRNVNATVRLTGPLHQGDFDFAPFLAPGTSVDSDDGWALLANPYASPIEWGNAGWIADGIGGTVYVRNNSSDGSFQFMIWNGSAGDEEFAGVIAQGQSFWVKGINGTPALIIGENAKHDAQSAVIYRKTPPSNLLTFTLAKGDQIDRAFIHFGEDFSNEPHDLQDGINRANSYFDLTTLADGIELAINSLSIDFCETRIPLNLSGTPAGAYTLDVSRIESFTFDVDIKVIDHFAGKTIDLKQVPRYTFNVTSDANSYGASRLELVLTKQIRDEQEFSTLNQVCAAEGNAVVTVTNAQLGATYQVMSGSDVITSFTGQGGTMEFLLPLEQMREGPNSLVTRAAFAGCPGFVLSDPIELILTALTRPVIDNMTVCEGDAVTLAVKDPASDGTYRWFESADSSAPVAETTSGEFVVGPLFKTRTYYVSQLQGNCESERAEVTIEVNYLNVPEISIDRPFLQSSSDVGNQWLLNGVEIPGATGNTYTPDETGLYAVRLDDGICQKTSAQVSFVFTALEGNLNKRVRLHPNPAYSAIHITLSDDVPVGEPVGVALYSPQGFLIKQLTEYNNSEGIDVDIGELSTGFYVMSIEINGQRVMKRFVKE